MRKMIPLFALLCMLAVPAFAYDECCGKFFIPLSAFRLSGTSTTMQWSLRGADGDIAPTRFAARAETYATYGLGVGLGYQFDGGISVSLQALGTRAAEVDAKWLRSPSLHVEDERAGRTHGHGDSDVVMASPLGIDSPGRQTGYEVTVTIPLGHRR